MASTAASPSRWPLIAAIVLGLGLGLSLWFGITQQGRASRAEHALDSLNALHTLQNQQWSQMQETALSCETDIAALADPHTRRIPLLGLNAYADNRVDLFWNDHTGELRAKVIGLQPPPPGQVYQLWALGTTGEVSMGILEVRNEPAYLQDMNLCPLAQGFVITLAPSGGNALPDLNKTVLAGVPQ